MLNQRPGRGPEKSAGGEKTGLALLAACAGNGEAFSLGQFRVYADLTIVPNRRAFRLVGGIRSYKSKLVGAALGAAAAAPYEFAISPDATHSTAAKDSGGSIQN
jgi:hypothetical protein